MLKKLLILVTIVPFVSFAQIHEDIINLFDDGLIFDGATGISYDRLDERGQRMLSDDGRRKLTRLPDDFRDIIKDTGVKIVNTGPGGTVEMAESRIERIQEKENFLFIKSYNHLATAFREKKLGINFYIQKPFPISTAGLGRALTFEQVIEANVSKWMNDLHIRVFQLSYGKADNDRLRNANVPNYPGKSEQFYAGGRDEPYIGLTKEGLEIVHQVYDRGGLIDVSHTGRAATNHIIQIALEKGKPLTANHIGVTSLYNWDRNKDDRTICGIAATNGVVGVSPVKSLLVERNRAATWRDFIRHLNHIRNIDCTPYIGYKFNMTKHMNIALDTPLEGWEEDLNPEFFVDNVIKGIDRWRFIANEMYMGTVDGVQYSLDELKRIFGLNLHRVYYRFLPRMSGASPLTVRIRPSRFGIGYAGTFSWMSPTFTRMPSRQVISTVEIQRLVRGTWKNFRTINAGITNSYTTRDFILFRGQYRYRINSYTSFSPGFPMKSISRFQNFEIR